MPKTMPKTSKRNPMPRAVRAGRNAMWIEAAIALVVGGLLVLLHHTARDFVPPAAEHDVYRGAAGLGGLALFLLLAIALMHFQWRVLWVLILLVQVAAIVGLAWLLFTSGLYWALCIGLLIAPITIIGTLTERFARRWFNH
ncbi:hypothetical protein K3N28_01190 [Glycomyces sp. TRM65418]|uniref:hypothetical protein n=1 Tax=Glycomyces sp. TRM65418 TaxID=2867006 RepID=UPI001CE4B8A8|nr:hypothetical protein [Glycomyces sp. TRM65418]MCC3761688.1 hypothetical protein [Glycomyces sp. TRM65418]QZD55781.1 hypothetical protein K3N28_01180 [Glycomyces sp. TRM65418]